MDKDLVSYLEEAKDNWKQLMLTDEQALTIRQRWMLLLAEIRVPRADYNSSHFQVGHIGNGFHQRIPAVWAEGRGVYHPVETPHLVVKRVADQVEFLGRTLGTRAAVALASALLAAAGARMTCEHVLQEAQADG